MFAKVAKSRRNMFSVMNHSGFGAITIYSPLGYRAEIPVSLIKRNGTIKKQVSEKLNELTKENVIKLENMGVRLYVNPALAERGSDLC